MNDELTGQLTSSQWSIPKYAHGLLWLETDAETVKTEGEHGLFTLTTPAQMLIIRWGGADGPALAQLRWQADSLAWEGTVQIGGYIDAMHTTEALNLPEAVTVLRVGGQPLKAGTAPFPARGQRRRVPYPADTFFDALVDDVQESVTTWMALTESSVLYMAQDALVSKLPVHCYGSLADHEAGWHDLFALPIALEAMTLFPP